MDMLIKCIILIGLGISVKGQDCYNGQDPCNATYPCEYGSRIPAPQNCQYYFQCISTHEWSRVEDDCTGSQSFDMYTCMCVTSGEDCFNSTTMCDGGYDYPDLFNVTEPTPCVTYEYCEDGEIDVADMYMCSRYHTCINNEWVPQWCRNNYYFRVHNSQCNPGIENCVDKPCSYFTQPPPDFTTAVPAPAPTTVVPAPTTAVPAPAPTTVVPAPTTPVPGELTTLGDYVLYPCYNDMDPCEPPYPCELRTRLPVPGDCNSYRHCVAPYEWVDVTSGCKESFDHETCECDIYGTCFPDNVCPDGPLSPPDIHPNPEPCLPGTGACTEGDRVPDLYYCTTYHQCESGVWVSYTCTDPVYPYFNPNNDECATDLIVCGDGECFGNTLGTMEYVSTDATP